jgi:ketosteroid isomerase-like protein
MDDAFRSALLEIIEIYKESWEQQDPQKILTIFSEDAIYHERVLEEPMRGHKGIAQYWQTKVVEGQREIKFKLLNLYIDNPTGIAEWEVFFIDTQQGVSRHMKEVAILDIEDGKIRSLREYWACEILDKI